MRSLILAFGLLAICGAAQAECISPFTMLESAEMRAEHHHGVAAMVQGSEALWLASIINSVGEPTDYRGDQLVIWTEPDNDKAMVAFALDGCGTGDAATFQIKGFRAVLDKAYPRHAKQDWRPL